MEMYSIINYDAIYSEIKDEFKKVIKNDEKLKQVLFNPDFSTKRVKLSSNHLKELSHTKGAKPEAITTKFIKELLVKIGIPSDSFLPEVKLDIPKLFKENNLNRYPDLLVVNKNFKKDINKNLLFEIEALNKDLTKKYDGEGIEQAHEWFQKSIGLYREYNAIVTNFNEWYYLKYDQEGNLKIAKKTPYEILEIIRYIALGQEKPYLGDEIGEAVSKEFFEKFSKRVKKLLDPKNNEIKIIGLSGSYVLKDDKIAYEKIEYYRKIFHRLLFIKILLDWKLFQFDPIQFIIHNQEKWNVPNLIRDLFFKVLNNDKDRIDIPDRLKELPFLNGGLFRYSTLEEKNPNVNLNSDAYIDIWNFLKKYNFIVNLNQTNKEITNDINPDILGYIFEKSIGDFRKSSGTYYTRAEIAKYISKNILYTFIFDKINKKFPKYKIYSLDQILAFHNEIQIEISDYIIEILYNLKICDPFVGSGAFLVNIGEIMVNIYEFIYRIKGWQLSYREERKIDNDPRLFKDLLSLKTHIVQNNLYGIDINTSAVDICKLRLWLWIIQPPSYQILVELFINPLPNIEYNIREGNSLIGYTQEILKSDLKDKVTGEIVKIAPISEWFGQKNLSLMQMLKSRNEKINEYYNETNPDKRDLLKKEIKQITKCYNNNFDKLLLQDLSNNNIIAKTIKILPIKLQEIPIKSIASIKIKIKNKFSLDLTQKEKNSILNDERGILIKGVVFRANSITIQKRVFYPKISDKFKPQNPYDFFKKITRVLSANQIENLEIKLFLDEKQLKRIKRFHWSMEFSNFFNEGGFHIIITNPPYGNILKTVEKRILALKDDITEDIYINFLLKLSRKEIPFEYAGILCPKSYLIRHKYLDFRNIFLNQNSLFEITDIGSKQFHGATNEVQIVFFNANHNYSNNLKIKDFYNNETTIIYKTRNFDDASNAMDELRICKNKECKYYDSSSSFYYYTFKAICTECSNNTLPLNRIRIKLTNEIKDILYKIEKNSNLNYLNPIDFPKLIRGEEDVGLREIKKIIRDSTNGSCYFISARNDFMYYYVDMKKSFNLEEINQRLLKGNNYEYYIRPKLLIKHNNIVPEAYYTESKICFTSSIYSLLHDNPKELKFLCAIMNSMLIQFYCHYGINNQKDTTINLNQYMIRHLPIIMVNENIKDELASKVDEIIKLFKLTKGKKSNEICSLIRKIDDFIFDLYFIDEIDRELIISDINNQYEYFREIYGNK